MAITFWSQVKHAGCEYNGQGFDEINQKDSHSSNKLHISRTIF